MMLLYQWAKKWGVPAEAIEELKSQLNIDGSASGGSESEGSVQTKVRLEASRKGCRLWRNNVGATFDTNGNFIRYGLANDSKKINDSIKSSDLIGIRPLKITEGMVGCTIGQFLAREIKAGDWKFKATKRENAQLNFINLVLSFGGDAAFANREGTL
jgi:hypothetical protein